MIINKTEIIGTVSIAITLNQLNINPVYSLGFYPVVKLVKYFMNHQKKSNTVFSIFRYFNNYFEKVFLSTWRNIFIIFASLEGLIIYLIHKNILDFKYLLVPVITSHLIELLFHIGNNLYWNSRIKQKIIRNKKLKIRFIENLNGVLTLYTRTPIDNDIIPTLELCTNSTITDLRQENHRKNIYLVKHVHGGFSEYKKLPKCSFERLVSILKVMGDKTPIYVKTLKSELETEYMFVTSISQKKLVKLREDIEFKFGSKRDNLRINFEEGKVSFIHKHTDNKTYDFKDKILQLKRKPLTFLLGVHKNGLPVSYDFKSLGHCLIGGMTGSGKSTTLHMLIRSMMFFSDDIFFYMIDLKGNELPDIYENFNNCKVIGIEDKETLKESISAIALMFEEIDKEYRKRIRAFKQLKVKDIDSYNKLSVSKLPYIVVLIDEANAIEEIIKRKGTNTEYETIVDTIDNIAARGRSTGIFNLHAVQQLTDKVYSVSWRRAMMTKIGMKLNEAIQCRCLSEGTSPEIAENMLKQDIGEMTIIDKYNKVQTLQATLIDENDIIYKNLKNKFRKENKFESEEKSNETKSSTKVNLEKTS